MGWPEAQGNMDNQSKCKKVSLKQSIRACNIHVTSWEVLAASRIAWRQFTVSGVKSFEEQQLDQLDAKHQARKNVMHLWAFISAGIPTFVNWTELNCSY